MSSIGRRAFARTLLLASGLVVAAACGSDLPTTTKTTTQTAAAPRRTVTIDPNVYYVIRNLGTDKVADVESAGCCNGYWIHQWTYEGQTNQQWQIVDLGNGYYKIVARHSGRVMDVESASLNDGARVHQWGYDGSTNQQWSINDTGSGTVYFLARHSGKALTVSGSGSITADGVGIKQYTYAGTNLQKWYLEVVR
ncbi:MAG: RICIN domain-containing protein [Longimicrobiaceae bacterium]